jgi:plastocyanin
MNNASKWAAAAALASLAAASSMAASYRVVVLGADGRPAGDAVVLLQMAGSHAAEPLVPETVVINQKDLRFQPYLTVVPVGSTVRFVNLDNFDHHVRSQAGGPLGSVPPVKQFEFRLAAFRAGKQSSAELKFESPGSVVLGCHIHGSMRGHLLVTSAPFQAITDNAGTATLMGLPEGPAEVRLWHPDQLVDQAAQRVTLSGNAESTLQLNFTPRRRPPPRKVDEYQN